MNSVSYIWTMSWAIINRWRHGVGVSQQSLSYRYFQRLGKIIRATNNKVLGPMIQNYMLIVMVA